MRHVLVQSQQWKHQNYVWNLFKVFNKDTRTTSLTPFWIRCKIFNVHLTIFWTLSVIVKFGIVLGRLLSKTARKCISWTFLRSYLANNNLFKHEYFHNAFGKRKHEITFHPLLVFTKRVFYLDGSKWLILVGYLKGINFRAKVF